MRAFVFYKKYKVHLFLILVTVVLFSSCSSKSTSVSGSDLFTHVDDLLSVEDYKGSWSSLKKMSKDLSRPTEILGLVKRALYLDKIDFAKEQLKNALYNNPDNQELLAVYAHLLIKEKSYEEAYLYAKRLEGGAYGSIYSELRFKTDSLRVDEINDEKKKKEKTSYLDFYSPYYAQAYMDIYTSTGNAAYLRNVALLYALTGDMETAVTFCPDRVSVYDKPIFWAYICYDAGDFARTVENLTKIKLDSEQLLLLADAYLHLNEIDSAFMLWNQAKNVFNLDSPLSWHNIAVYYKEQDDQKSAHDLVVELTDTFPYYVDGLCLYSTLSEKEIHTTDTYFTPYLEEKGLQSLQMEKDSLIVELDVRTAIQKIESALQAIPSNNDNAITKLLIELEKLHWDVANPRLTAQQKTADIWLFLEKTMSEEYTYNAQLVQFAVWYFLTQNMVEEADAIFTSHCTSRYAHMLYDVSKYNKEPIPGMEKWELEFGAYIALVTGHYTDAFSWFEALMPNSKVTYGTPINAIFNFASLQEMYAKPYNALRLYEQMLKITRNHLEAAEIYYRMALVQQELGETKKVLYLLEESVKHDVGHSAAQTMLKKL